MIEIICDGCGCHVGYITDSGPHGLVYCDECYLNEQDELEDKFDINAKVRVVGEYVSGTQFASTISWAEYCTMLKSNTVQYLEIQNMC